MNRRNFLSWAGALGARLVWARAAHAQTSGSIRLFGQLLPLRPKDGKSGEFAAELPEGWKSKNSRLEVNSRTGEFLSHLAIRLKAGTDRKGSDRFVRILFNARGKVSVSGSEYIISDVERSDLQFVVSDSAEINGNEPPLQVSVGPISVRSTQENPAVRVKDGEIFVWATTAEPVQYADNMDGWPMKFLLKPLAGLTDRTGRPTGMRINLSKMVVSLGADLFALTSRATVVVAGVAREFPSEEFSSLPLEYGLVQTADEAEVTFRAVSSGVLPLHSRARQVGNTERWELEVPASLAECMLRLRVKRAGSRVIVSEVYADPGRPEGAKLTLYSFADRSNDSVAMRARVSIPLRIRRDGEGVASGLLIGPGRTPLVEASSPGAGMKFHGLVDRIEYRVKGQVTLVCASCIDSESAILASESAPVLSLRGTELMVAYPNAGDTYRPASVATGGTAEVLTLKGKELTLPLFEPGYYGQFQARVQTEFEQSLQKFADQQRPVRHSTQFVERPLAAANATWLKVKSIFSSGRSPELRLETYTSIRDYGPIQFELVTKPDSDPDYVAISSWGGPSKVLFKNGQERPSSFRLDFGQAKGCELLGKPEKSTNGLPLVILKMSTRLTLRDILNREAGTNSARLKAAKDLGDFIEEGNPELLASAWTGAILLNAPVTYEKFDILQGILPTKDKRFVCPYLALTAGRDGNAGREDFSIAAHYRYPDINSRRNAALEKKSLDGLKPEKQDDEAEFALRTDYVNLLWRNSRLESLDIICSVYWRGLFGLRHPSPPDPLKIVAQYDQMTQSIRFVGRIDGGYEILPAGVNLGPLKQVLITSAEIVFDQGSGASAVVMSGRVDLRRFGITSGNEWFSNAKESVRFSGLRIALGSDPDPSWRWFSINYPSLEFELGDPQFRFGLLELALEGIVFHWKNDEAERVKWWGTRTVDTRATGSDERSWALPNWIKNRSVLGIRFRLNVMKPPELARNAQDRLSFAFLLGLGAEEVNPPSKWDQIVFRLEKVAIDNFKLDLLRFINLTCDRVELGLSNTESWIQFWNVTAELLGTKLIQNWWLRLYAKTAGGGANPYSFFAGYVNESENNHNPEHGGQPPQEAKAIGGLRLDWLVIGHGVKWKDEFTRPLLRLPTRKEGGPANGGEDFGRDSNNEVRDALNGYLTKTLDRTPDHADDGGETSGWLFGAGFSWYAPFFTGRFLFHDRKTYAIAMTGTALRDLCQQDIAMAAFFVKGSDPNLDRFAISIGLPTVIVSSFAFVGGDCYFELVVDGDFFIDFGFPHREASGRRAWERAIGIIGTSYQGSGGFYLRKERGTDFAVADGRVGLMLAAGGLAIQGGLGGASDSHGGFRVTATVGFYAIVDGRYIGTTHRAGNIPQVCAYSLEGALGILLRGVGELNWWVISVRVEVCLMAENSVRIRSGWSELLENLSGEEWSRGAQQKLTQGEAVPRDVYLEIRFTVVASISASACIGGRWFRVCMGVSVSVPMTVNTSLKLA